MPSNSEIILSAQTHPDGSTVETVTGDKFKGDGYYGRSDGLHTVQISVTDLVGTISVQGTLEIDPQESDWFTLELSTTEDIAGAVVDTTGAITTTKQVISSLSYSQETAIANYNFKGNFVWVRAKVTDWTDGTINSIRLNH